MVSQSSSIAISVTMADIGLPLHSVVTVGNAAQLGVAQVAEALLASERVSAVGLIVESLADLRAWERLAACARERRIGLVALVLGPQRAGPAGGGHAHRLARRATPRSARTSCGATGSAR